MPQRSREPLEFRHVTEYNPPPPPFGEAHHKGRKPQGERALTGAERQARYRRRQADNRAVTRPRPSRSARRLSQVQQWHAAVATLIALQAKYAVWLDALPEPLRDTTTGEALQAIVDLDLDELASIEPPRGFGRD
jgi:ferric-dicitrate binding protein FerR (iron transport regulator)